MEKIQDKNTYDKYSLDIYYQNGNKFRFIIVSPQLKFYSNLINILYPKDPSSIYGVAYRFYENSMQMLYKTQSSEELDGWLLYNPKFEYERIGALKHPKLRVTQANSNFYVCKTYPEFNIVPCGINDKEIQDCSNFRTKNRFPTLAYVNHKYKGSIWRSSQPKSGLTNNRNTNDELMLKCIGAVSEKLVIYDARPYIAAMGNRVKGGGSEVIENYNRVRLIYCEIDNIHAVSKAYSTMFSMNRK